MGGNDSGMQKQRAIREEVVRRKRNFSDDILSMGTCGAEQSGRCNAEARGAGFCRAGSAETGVALKADFKYTDAKSGDTVIEDVKGKDMSTGKYLTTEAFRLKWKLLKQRYPEFVFKLF